MNNRIFRAFGERSFFFLWVGEVFTQVAVNLLNFFLILLVFSLTKSNTAVSGIVMSFTIPAILFGILAGVYVDRWNKKEVLFVSNIIRAVLLIIMGFFDTNLAVLYVGSFLIAFATQFFIPAETPLIPLLVKEKLLFSANAMFGLALYGSVLIGYVISGPLILSFGHRNTFFFLAGLLAIGAAWISLIRVPQQEIVKRKVTRRAISHEIHEAFSLLRSNRDVYSSLFLLALSQILLLIIAVVAPGYASQVLDMKIEDFPLLFVAPAALGVLIGAIVLANKYHDHPKSILINIGVFVSGFAMVAMPFGSRLASRDFVQTINSFLPPHVEITTLHLLIVLAFILGLANAFVFIPANTILQEKTADAVRGKIYGVLNTAIGLCSLLPIIIVGSLSDLIGVGRVIIGIGLILLVIGVSRVVLKH